MSAIFAKTPWGYSLPHFLSAVHNCHPNYSTNLLNKQTITTESINILLSQIPKAKKSIYDETLVEKLYLDFQKHKIDDKKAQESILQLINGRKILILAPGMTLISEKDKIDDYIKQENPIIISVNFEYEKCDFTFVSNLKRFNNMVDNLSSIKSIIVTSNITTKENDNLFLINYGSLLLEDYTIDDNAGLMLINFLRMIGMKEFVLAGFDGFKSDKSQNYFDKNIISNVDTETLMLKNKAIKLQLNKFSEVLSIRYLTTSCYNDSLEQNIAKEIFDGIIIGDTNSRKGKGIFHGF